MSQVNVTTIKLTKETKSRLEKLKVHPKESYEDVLLRLLDILNLCKLNPLQARLKLREIEVLKARLKKS